MVCKLLLCLFLLIAGAHLHAQNATISTETKMVRWNVSGLIDPLETNLSFGLEYKLTDEWSVSTDAAWVFHSSYFSNPKKTNGLILRPAVRHYFTQKGKHFVEAEFHYKMVDHQMEDWLGRDCVEGVPSYEQFTSFIYRRQTLGLHIKTGWQTSLGKNNKFWLEFYLGAGLRKKWEGLHNQPNTCFNNANTMFGNLSENEIYPAIPIGFRLLYRL